MRGVGKYSKSTRKLKGKGGYAEDIGSSIGSWLGKKAGGLFKSITGLGTYAVTKNSLLANPNDPPVLSNTKGGTRVQHREYITDITGSTAFTLTPYSINPGLFTTFPWLSGVALNFEEYILHGLVFEFKSTSATALNSTNTALGTVIMATEYNVVSPNFTAKRDMENYVYSTSCSPDVSALHPVECARDINVLSELFVRNTTPVTGGDLRFSDIGKFQIATVGMQASANIGELWVTYDVELIKPRLPSSYTSIGPAHYQYDASAGIPPAGVAPTSTNMFGTSGSKLVLYGTGNTPVTLDTNVMTFVAPGRYVVLISILNNGVATTMPGVTLSSTVTTANIITSGTPQNFWVSPTDGTTNTLATKYYVFDVSTALATVPATVTFGTATLGTVSTFQLFIFPLPVGFTDRELSEIDCMKIALERLRKQVDDIKCITSGIEVDSDLEHVPDHSDLSASQVYRTVSDIVSQAISSRVATSTPNSQVRLGLP
jgi:hypothetical protein